MTLLLSGFRTVINFILASLLALAAFGLILALLSLLPGYQAPPTRLGLTLLSAALAFFLGGALSARLNPTGWNSQALAFGLLFGGFSFVYLLGATWNALWFTLFAVILATAGGWLAAGKRHTS
jgi:hypothetical protein